jgi:hypothetical protein
MELCDLHIQEMCARMKRDALMADTVSRGEAGIPKSHFLMGQVNYSMCQPLTLAIRQLVIIPKLSKLLEMRNRYKMIGNRSDK